MNLEEELKKLKIKSVEQASTYCEYDSLYNKGLWKLYKIWCKDNYLKESDGNLPAMFMKEVKEYESREDFRRILKWPSR